MLSHGRTQGHSSSSLCRLHASWQMQDFSQPKRTTCSPITHLLPAPGWPQRVQCQALPGLPAYPPHTSSLPSPPCTMGKPRRIPGQYPPSPGWMGHSVLLLSSRALGGLLIRVKIIISIFCLRKWSCKASEVTYPGLPPPKPGSCSPNKNIPLSSFNEAFKIISQSWREQEFIWSTFPFKADSTPKGVNFF